MESALKSPNQMEIENSMLAAYKTSLRTIAQLIPYLEHRAVVGNKYFSFGIGSVEREQCVEIVQKINDDIKKIMGIL